MIKEVVESRLDKNMDGFAEEIIDYFGNEYENSILEKMQGINIAIIRNSGVIDFEDSKIYVDKEPICAKTVTAAHIFLPVTIMKEKTGNVIFVHQLLHAICEETIKEENDLFNEIIIDYMANDICKGVKKRNINITFETDPVYESESFYSAFFPVVKEFYIDNKDRIIKSLMNNKCLIKKDMGDIVKVIEKKFERILNGEEIEKINKAIK